MEGFIERKRKERLFGSLFKGQKALKKKKRKENVK